MRDVDEKQFTTLAARFALSGHALIRSLHGEVPATLYATRWGMIKPLRSLEDAHAFLQQLGGSK